MDLASLNTQQRRAVKTIDGPVTIIAGPGTGKTKTLAARILYILQTGKAKPHEILALTFTKKAAAEMAERVGVKGPVICTFHALCQQLLGSEFTFVTEAERASIVKSLAKPAAFKGVSNRELGLAISRAKNVADASPELARIVKNYDATLQKRGLIDFDDLLLRARDALQSQLTNYPTYAYILIDEFQDTNKLQYEILQLLRKNDNMFIIGDPNQSIYGFRGANGTIFDQFAADFPKAVTISLVKNYRSAPPIVALSNAIFTNATPLQANSAALGAVSCTQFLNEYSEAHWVVQSIEAAIGGSNFLAATHDDAKQSLKDFAIVYRGRYVAKTIQKYVADSGLPYQIIGDGSPYDRADIQMLIQLLHCCITGPAAVGDFSQIQVATLLQKVDTNQPASVVAAQLVEIFAVQTNADIIHFIGTLVHHKTIAAALSYLDGLAENNFYDPMAEAITLLTIHAAKGLEFPHVFVVGAEEGVLPSQKGDLAEERRLFYVAVTRAKTQLNISCTQHRNGNPATPSQFITELSANILQLKPDANLTADARRLQKRHAKKAQTSLF
ncbi:MAG TPA: ATP-dependent helicase [Candidatus Saccharimonas sp.]|nr:ATP-dependent helicase [Candidatus Saccharimonas sp.]